MSAVRRRVAATRAGQVRPAGPQPGGHAHGGQQPAQRAGRPRPGRAQERAEGVHRGAQEVQHADGVGPGRRLPDHEDRRERHDHDARRGRNDQPPPQGVRLLALQALLQLGRVLVLAVLGGHAIARRAHRAFERGAGDTRHVLGARLARGQVDDGRQHAGHLRQSALHGPDAPGAVQAGEAQRGGGQGHGVAGRGDCRGEGRRDGRCRLGGAHAGARCGQVDAHLERRRAQLPAPSPGGRHSWRSAAPPPAAR